MDKREKYVIISSIISLIVVITGYVIIGSNALFLLPVAVFLPIFVYLQTKEKQFKCAPEVLMNESPTVIGMMSVTLSSGGSFENAIREVATNGPTNMSAIFKKIVLDADCREVPDIKANVFSSLSKLPKELTSFRRAMNIMATAFESGNPEERKMMVKDSEEIVLKGLRETGESYSSKLNTPCMLIFGLGIMVPMILISILPMLGIGGMFSTTTINSDIVAIVTLFVIPAIVGVVIFSLKGKNPFFAVKLDWKNISYMFPFVVAIPLFIYLNQKMECASSLKFSLIAAGLVTFALMIPALTKEALRKKNENMLKDAMFELGNRLCMGENYDTAITRAFSSRKDCEKISKAMSRELDLCRGDISAAVSAVLSPISKLMAGFYDDVYRASIRDTRDAGKLALSIAHQLQDQGSVRKDIENKLKSMLDMMTGTAAIFAPLILGLSVVMLAPLGEITGAEYFGDISMTLVVYLIELSALIAILSSNLMCKGGLLDIESRFCAMMPVALIVFTACSAISL